MERSIQIFAVANLTIIGLSHMLAPRAWAQFFLWLRAKQEAGVFVVAFLSLGFGSVIVAYHPVWSGLPLLLTVLGWAQIVKALVYFIFPNYGLRRLAWLSPERAYVFVAPGALLFAVGG